MNKNDDDLPFCNGIKCTLRNRLHTCDVTYIYVCAIIVELTTFDPNVNHATDDDGRTNLTPVCLNVFQGRSRNSVDLLIVHSLTSSDV